MGVMECRRNGCTNILCDRYSKEYGYICNDCFNELCETNLTPAQFMNTYKKLPEIKDRYKKFRIELLEEEFALTSLKEQI